ncbi:arginase [Rubricella aquisinus]|uniref:Arginase n=1 Tax=Rubricella aquisinus TaxID=2028108 RepID=A0A840WM63_9RHOB|nr:arginase [Rubricella aquisinus]MBB5515213.1 arginase [Rubricella aquisinus]
MSQKTCILVGAPVQSGAGQPGCVMGPAAYRTAGLGGALTSLGHRVEDRGDVAIAVPAPMPHANDAVENLAEFVSWTHALTVAAADASKDGLPIFLGGDHSLAAGTVAGVAQHAAALGQPQFVLWLDAHPDFHALDSTESGHLHGTPVAYFTGQDGFAPALDTPTAPVPAENVCMMGIRSVDRAENLRLAAAGVTVHDMRAIDEQGIAAPLRAFLSHVAAVNGRLHLSLDVDFLDPDIAPAVGTTVPGGATFREAHLIMEMLHDSGLVTSLDLVELNPFLDLRGRTAKLMVDLTASLMGRTVLDRKTRSY